MNRYVISLAAILLCTITAVGAAAPQIGDKGPAIKVAKWVTRQPPALPGEPKADNHVYLIEFWATWCAPCLKSIPHMGALQKKHEKDGLVVIGVSNEDPETIATFMKIRQKMPYYVASDDEMATTTAWTKDIPGIPCTFLVDRAGIVVWQGNPLADPKAMDKAIEEVLAGTYDLEAAKQAATIAREYGQLMSELQPAHVLGDKEKVFKLLDQMIKLKPEELHAYLIKRQILHEFDMADQVPAWDVEIFEAFKDSSAATLELASFELQKPFALRNPEMMLRCAIRANELAEGRDAQALHVMARVHCELGMLDTAIDIQTQAAALASEDVKERYDKVLTYYKAARKLANEQRGRTNDKP